MRAADIIDGLAFLAIFAGLLWLLQYAPQIEAAIIEWKSGDPLAGLEFLGHDEEPKK